MKKINLRYLIRKARNPFKALKIFIKRKLGWMGIPIIIPYAIYSNNKRVYISGAVIEDKGLAKPGLNDSAWKNLLTTIKRYSGDEIAGAAVQVSYGGHNKTVRTDERGIFRIILEEIKTGETKQLVNLKLLDELTDKQGKVSSDAKVHRISPKADFIVISDIDDTVMISHSTQTLKKLRLMFFKNATTRNPFPGVASFYQALQQGSTVPRPLFYVSSSEWNLYDLLLDFFKLKGLPSGPLLLSDNKLKLLKIRRSGKKHETKFTNVQQLFEFFTHHEFILIGDSGQQDPELYLKIAEMYPSRVKAIYIRQINNAKRNMRLEELSLRAGEIHTELVTVKTTFEAAKHAYSMGFISQEHLKNIQSEQETDH